MRTTTSIKIHLCLFAIILLITTATTFAVNYTSRASGNWNTTTTWNPNGVPGIGDNVTINGNGFTVTVTANEACASLTFGADGNNTTLTMNAGTTLTVNGNVVFNAPTTRNRTKLWNINTGTATVGGTVTLNAGTADSRVTQINITTGTLDVAGNVIFSNTSSDTRTRIIFTGAGNLRIGGNLGSTGNYGTLTPSTGTVTFDGFGAQSVVLVGAMSLYNAVVNKPSGTATINIPATTPVAGTFTVSSGTALIAADITITGNLTVSGGTLDLGTAVCTRSAAGGTFSLGSGATLRLGGNHGFSNAGYNYVCNFPNNFTTYTLNAASTVEYYLAGNQDIPYDNFTYGNLITSGSGTKMARQEPVATPTPLQDSSFVVNGTLTIKAGTTLNTAQNVFYARFNGNVEINASGILDAYSGGGAVRTIFSGSTLNAVGTYSAANGVYNGFGSETRFGNTTITGNPLTLYQTVIDNGKLTTSNVNITLNSGNVFWIEPNATFVPASTALITLPSPTLRIFGTARVTRANSNAAGQYIVSGTPAGDYTTGTFDFNGTNETVDNIAWGNLIISGPSVSLNQSMTTAPIGNLTVTGTFDLSTYQINGNSSGKILTLGPSGILVVGGTSGGVTGSNFPTGYTGTPSINATSKVTYDGTAAQTIANTVTYGILEVNNTAGVNLTNGSATTSTLTMTAGNMTTGANMVTVTSFRNGNGLIIGSIRHLHTFTTGTPYYFEGPNTFINFSTVGTSPSDITITSYPNTLIPVGPKEYAIKRYYTITTNGGSELKGTLCLHYDATTELNDLTPADELSFTLWRWNGTAWEDQGGISGGAGTANAWVQQAELTNLTNNYWTIAVGGGALPVQLTSFTASAKKFDITLEWKTASEKNNYGFDIERQSTDGVWTKIGFVGGHGTTTVPQEYSYTDRNAPSGRLSYRLKQTDFDGKFEYCSAVEVVSGAIEKSFVLGQNYPSPFNPVTTIEFSIPDDSPTSLKVYNTLGQEVATLIDGQGLSSGLIHRVTFDGSNLSSGTYYYVLKSGKYSAVKKMIFLK